MSTIIRLTDKKAAVLLLMMSVCCYFYSSHARRFGMVGGLSEEEKEANDDIRELVNSIKSEIEHKLHTTYDEINPIKYKSQIVSGINYFIKAIGTKSDGGRDHIHLRIYKPLSGSPELESARKTSEHSPIKYFW